MKGGVCFFFWVGVYVRVCFDFKYKQVKSPLFIQLLYTIKTISKQLYSDKQKKNDSIML